MRRNGMGISIGFFCLALMTMLLLAHGVYAQSTTNGAIGGSVRDPQGLAIAKAKITVHNAGTSKDTFVEADDIGEFRAANLQPGNYTVTAQAAGFAATQLENVVVQVGSVTEVEVRL